MTPLSKAVRGMTKALQKVAGHFGDYSRQGGGSARIKGVLTEREYEVVDDEGIATVVKSHDWLFRAEELKAVLPPKPGDRFRLVQWGSLSPAQSDDLAEHCFEAMNIGKQPCFEHHDPEGIQVIVHMKKVHNA